jgi:putative nucleotidyltransferase with HDIG domain
MLTLDSFIESIDYLPPMPRNVTSLINLLNRTDIDVDQIVELVQYDPALTAQVIRHCNSAFFGGAPASDLHEATVRVGYYEILQLVVALSTATLMRPQQKGYGIEAGELWKHSVTAALVGKLMAMDRGADVSLVFTACMLHDLGKVALSRSLEGKYDEVIAETKRSQSPMLVVEQKLLGFDHAEVGGRLLERWNFPAALVQAVRFHHDPAAAPEHGQLAAYAYLANMVACFMGFGCGHQALACQGRAEALDLIGTTPEELPRYMTKAFYAIRDTEALLCFPFGK